MEVKELLGKTLVSVTGAKGDEEARFVTVCGKEYVMLHHQDCCEYVYLEDVVGDLQDLIGSPITEAEEATNQEDPPAKDSDQSHTWTFYKLGTKQGSVTLRWFGSSNGYYSEGVDFEQVAHA